MRLARLLAKRIRQAGGASLGFQPVFVPQTARKGQPPAGGPDLAPMALAAGDLPAGAQLTNDAYVANRTALGKYVREFDFPTARLGGANLFSVESELNLLRSDAEASGVMVRLRALVRLAGRRPGVHRRVQREGGQDRAAQVGRPRATRRSCVVLSFKVNGQTAHIAQVSLRVGRVIGLLNVGVVGPTFQPAAVEPLAVKLGKRIENGL